MSHRASLVLGRRRLRFRRLDNIVLELEQTKRKHIFENTPEKKFRTLKTKTKIQGVCSTKTKTRTKTKTCCRTKTTTTTTLDSDGCAFHLRALPSS